MQTNPVTLNQLAASVVAVPPLSRNRDGSLSPEENQRIVRHIEADGVRTLLYGGNANFYHLAPSEFEDTLAMLEEITAPDTLVIPAVGPAYGTFMDQAKTIRDSNFPTAMVLPMQGVTTDAGVATGFRQFVETCQKPAVLYIKHDGFIEPSSVARLVEDDLVSWIKYATVRENPADDPYLRELVSVVDPARIVSGIGEQPALVHHRDFGLAGFTSGCVCLAPALSQEMLDALRAGDHSRAWEIQSIFRPLEDLRNAIHPIRVLHAAVEAVGIAKTGPQIPLLSELDPHESQAVADAALALVDGTSQSLP